jgi:CsoR family transcriptional regulator, copper-sensing transcriptional repressor
MSGNAGISKASFCGIRGILTKCTSEGYLSGMGEKQRDNGTVNDGEPAGEGDNPQAPVTLRRASTSYAHDKAKILARLRRMEGQVRGVQRMVEEDQYCLDVLTQLSAIIAAARQTGLLVLEDHVRGCVLGSCGTAEDENAQEELLVELIGAIDRFGRSVG